ncbi:MAG: S49 family peptidase, partial [Muribaculaceae bacterium]|nr:S49 family peptidase [Muribaculaceae bacterium]
MLKKFFLNFLSSFAAVWVALGLFTITAVIVIFALIGKAGASMTTTESVKKHSIMTIELSGTIEERERPTEIDYIGLMQGDIERPLTLDMLVSAIREAADNKSIDMIYLKCDYISAAPATLHALRQELVDFRKSGKKIYAYGDGYTLGTYYVASAADSIFVNPVGSIAIQGLGGTTMYMKDLFDNLGIEFEVVKVGTFKSAVEPFIMNEMSAPARAQLDTLYGDMWRYIKDDISARRKISATQIDDLINKDHLMLQDGVYDVKCKLADRAVYEREVDEILAEAVGVDKEKLNFVSPATVAAMAEIFSGYNSKRQIAVLYATGEIAEGSKTGINCEALVPVIVDLAEDDNVRGLVLRVNSPGGSVFGSELIGEALEYFKSKGKPFAVSMGDYAASGGYWISCVADRIFSYPLTINLSIGIYGLLP